MFHSCELQSQPYEVQSQPTWHREHYPKRNQTAFVQQYFLDSLKIAQRLQEAYPEQCPRSRMVISCCYQSAFESHEVLVRREPYSGSVPGLGESRTCSRQTGWLSVEYERFSSGL